MRIVIIESPYAGDIAKHTRYAQLAMADSLGRGEAPYASHLLYTQPHVLRDSDPLERMRGIDAGFAFKAVAAATVVYTDCGISKGMTQGIGAAAEMGQPVEYRTLPGWEP